MFSRTNGLSEAARIFLGSHAMPVPPESGQIFLTVTHREACWLHFATMLALAALTDATKTSPVVANWLAAADEVDEEMWTKIMDSVKVQILGMDPTTDEGGEG